MKPIGKGTEINNQKAVKHNLPRNPLSITVKNKERQV